MEYIRFLCSVRVCRALVDKYKKDPRLGLMWEAYVWDAKKEGMEASQHKIRF